MDKKISLDLAQQHYYLHISSAQQQSLFSSVFAYDALLSSLETHTDIDLYGYCLFPDGIHLLVLSHKPPSYWLESWLMHYNQWHQDTTGETGYLFDDDHIHQVLIQPKHLCKTLRHIHYLPVEQKKCSSPEQFLYSSYHDYIGTQQTGVNTETILATLSPHYGQRLRRFYDYMAIANTEAQSVFCSGNHDYYLAYADAHYLMQARSNYQSKLNETPESEHLLTWQRCIQCLVENNGLDTENWLGRQRHHSLPDAHFLLAWMFTQIAKGPLYIAAKQLNIDETTLTLKINSIHLHHPAKYLRYIERSWKTATV
ncbi:MAG: hypothetical protein CL679_11380 [Bermanella sp.]|nr:hypothetical protein [Bermanella sp.]|tara:strand:- start:217 stop:1152 length:936 start_codon:yes stop_codon:yes gene_type:complete